MNRSHNNPYPGKGQEVLGVAGAAVVVDGALVEKLEHGEGLRECVCNWGNGMRR